MSLTGKHTLQDRELPSPGEGGSSAAAGGEWAGAVVVAAAVSGDSGGKRLHPLCPVSVGSHDTWGMSVD
jgi:hypothetical protein